MLLRLAQRQALGPFDSLHGSVGTRSRTGPEAGPRPERKCVDGLSTGGLFKAEARWGGSTVLCISSLRA